MEKKETGVSIRASSATLSHAHRDLFPSRVIFPRRFRFPIGARNLLCARDRASHGDFLPRCNPKYEVSVQSARFSKDTDARAAYRTSHRVYRTSHRVYRALFRERINSWIKRVTGQASRLNNYRLHLAVLLAVSSVYLGVYSFSAPRRDLSPLSLLSRALSGLPAAPRRIGYGISPVIRGRPARLLKPDVGQIEAIDGSGGSRINVSAV